ncbi:uncharacterized protein LOC123549250 [Mercenaria mercenaria]|uniref:uncharacterized protein LOC123549250 n=1 Tax=Mercenaria mercenaria TaxID=6596 RepID=UPI00234F0942|nr:uncharacterized protein LOC123549250 [Mercenaria mercenaria]XP_053401514.1 uncharacterized protein LOC123549250 [Mercenaria mercenaria]XP_053401515.1 uncharacterized protein LOC123549250 [Mercenaria mercenaria]
MERGRTFYITLVSGLVALVLLLVSLYLPAQLVFESKPYALVVLKSGNLDGWSAEELGLTSAQLDMVKNNYEEFLSRHKTADDSEDSDSSDDDDTDGSHKIVHMDNLKSSDKVSYHTHAHGGKENHENDDNDDRDNNVDDDDDNHNDDEGNNDDDDDDDKRRKRRDADDDDDDKGVEAEDGDDDDDDDDDDESSSSSSSSDDDSDEESSSDSVVLTLEQRLQGKAVSQTVGFGLFHGTMCSVMKTSKERCHSISVNEAIFAVKQEVTFMENDINMPMWNNLRVESLFSVITCILGLVCLFASLKPCCDNKRLPVYLGSVSFFASGVLVFIPIVRILLVSSDFEQNLVTDLNVTTKLLTSWSLVASGIGAPFALMASFTLIATKWYKVTKKWYHVLKPNHELPEYAANGKAVEIKMTDLERKEAEGNIETRKNIYQHV